MQRLVSRRRLLKSGAALAATVPLAGVGRVSAKPSARAAHRIAWSRPASTPLPMTERVLARAPGLVIEQNPMTVYPEEPCFAAVMEARRQFNMQARERKTLRGVGYSTEWLWSLPPSLRDGLLELVASVEDSWHVHIGDALANSFFTFQNAYFDHAGVKEANQDDFWPTPEQMDAAARQPITVAGAFAVLAIKLGMPIETWLNPRDAEVVMRAAAAA